MAHFSGLPVLFDGYLDLARLLCNLKEFDSCMRYRPPISDTKTKILELTTDNAADKGASVQKARLLTPALFQQHSNESHPHGPCVTTMDEIPPLGYFSGDAQA